MIKKEEWGLLLLNGEEGVLSIGGSSADVVEQVNAQNKEALDRIGQAERGELSVADGGGAANEQAQSNEKVLEPGILRKRALLAEQDNNAKTEDKWKWAKVQGAAGWWQILMHGVYIENIQVLKNQPVIIDVRNVPSPLVALFVWAKGLIDGCDLKQVNTPFILAPAIAVRKFYQAMSGAQQLPAPNDHFWVFPCLNPPEVQFEFHGQRFPVLQGAKRVRPRPVTNKRDIEDHGGSNGNETVGAVNQEDHTESITAEKRRKMKRDETQPVNNGEQRQEEEEEEPPTTTHIGGKFSLGKLRPGSGYCVGAVVETKMDDTPYNEDGDGTITKKKRSVFRTRMQRVGWRSTSGTGNVVGNGGSKWDGLEDMWILGESFLGGVSALFDVSSLSLSLTLPSVSSSLSI